MSSNTPAPATYGGDEVFAVVLDAGSWTTRAGFSGEDSPKAVFSTYYGVQERSNSSIKSGTSIKSDPAQNKNNDTLPKDTDGDVEMQDGRIEKELSTQNGSSKGQDLPTRDGSSENEIKTRTSKTTQYFFGDNSIHVPRADTEIKNPMHEGIVSDWDAMEKVWDHALNNLLNVDMREHPFLITEQTWNPRSNREKALELAFESLQTPAFYIAKSPVASLFASGKGTGLVVDIGHEIVAITPVIDGLPHYKPARRSLYGGKFLADEVRHMLETRPIPNFPHAKTAINTPRYMIATRQAPLKLGAEARVILKNFPNAIVQGVPTKLFREFEILTRPLEEFKQTICQVSDTPYKPDTKQPAKERVFEFPDGSSHAFGDERFIVSESLFQPTLDQFQFNGFPIPSASATSGEDSKESDDKEKEKEKEAHESTEPKNSDKKELTEKKDESTSNTTTGSAATTTTATATTTTAPSTQQATPSYMINDVRPIAPFSRTLGLSDLIVSSINACDVEVRPNLANNVIITGGSSLVQGLSDRINNDLTQALPGLKIRLYAPSNMTERNFSPWLGGSILASLGSFHQLWISKREYEEVGAEKLLDRRFR